MSLGLILSTKMSLGEQEGFASLLTMEVSTAKASAIALVSTPIVVRQKGSEWTYVGDMFVNDYMDDQAVRERRSGSERLEEFVFV